MKCELSLFADAGPNAPRGMHLLLFPVGTGRAVLGKQAALEAPGKKSPRSTEGSRPCSTATVIH